MEIMYIQKFVIDVLNTITENEKKVENWKWLNGRENGNENEQEPYFCRL